LMFKFMMIFLTPSLFNLFKLRLFDGGAEEDFLVNIMKQSIEQRRKKGDSSKRSDFVDLLVQAVKVSKDELDDTVVVQDQFDKDAKISSTFKGEYLSSMSEDEKEVLIISQTMILFLAGFDTTSSTLAVVMHFLATNPESQDKLYQEIRNAVEDHDGQEDKMDYNSLNGLQYTENIIMESLRCYDFVGALERLCVKDYHIAELNFTAPKDMLVQIPGNSIMRDDQCFPNAKEFNPDNFDPEIRKTRSPYAFMSFGQGPRNCVGMRFAYLQMKLALVHIINNYQVLPCDKTPKELVADPTNSSGLAKGGMWVKLQPRDK
jgi:cytochrome P450